MYLIGLTGNIACGKSTVVAMLQAHGAAVCDADAIVHQIQQPGGIGYQPIIDQFGSQIQSNGPDSPINRTELGRIVFNDPEQLKTLEAIIHPLVRQHMQDWLAQQLEHGQTVAVIDAIKLLESGWKVLCNAIWVVTATPQQQLQRLMETRAMSKVDAQQRIAAQAPQAEKIAQADIVIDNSGSLAATEAQVTAAWRALPIPHGT